MLQPYFLRRFIIILFYFIFLPHLLSPSEPSPLVTISLVSMSNNFFLFFGCMSVIFWHYFQASHPLLSSTRVFILPFLQLRCEINWIRKLTSTQILCLSLNSPVESNSQKEALRNKVFTNKQTTTSKLYNTGQITQTY